jgi:septal ring factor EnvC (AmiA/AmiB activator)
VGLQLTVVAEDDKTRLRAAQWIAGEAEKSGKLKEEARKLRAEEVRKIEEILAAARDHGAAAEAAPPAKSAARSLLEEIRQAPPMEVEVPKPPAPEVRYIEKLVSKPGHFPPQFVKIAVRTTPSSDET